MEEKYVERLY